LLSHEKHYQFDTYWRKRFRLIPKKTKNQDSAVVHVYLFQNLSQLALKIDRKNLLARFYGSA
jgi:hypothetical protein